MTIITKLKQYIMRAEVCFVIKKKELQESYVGIVKDGKVLIKTGDFSPLSGTKGYPTPDDLKILVDKLPYETESVKIFIQINRQMIYLKYEVKIYNVDYIDEKIAINKHNDEIGLSWVEISKIHTCDLNPVAKKIFDRILS